MKLPENLEGKSKKSNTFNNFLKEPNELSVKNLKDGYESTNFISSTTESSTMTHHLGLILNELKSLTQRLKGITTGILF